MTDLLHVSPEVEAALRDTRPVVALESTLITHGLPWPENAATALAMEGRNNAVAPAPSTSAIAVLPASAFTLLVLVVFIVSASPA